MQQPEETSSEEEEVESDEGNTNVDTRPTPPYPEPLQDKRQGLNHNAHPNPR